jgi:hypothetical protein
MATKTKTAAVTAAAEPLSARIAAEQATADRLTTEAAAARQRAAQAAAEKARREAEAMKSWSEREVGRHREIWRDVDARRAEAVRLFKNGDVAAAHGAWVAWRSGYLAAEAEWGKIAQAFNRSHAAEGLRAPKGREFIGLHGGRSAERWADFSHTLTVELGREAAASARNRVLADLAAAVGGADVGSVAASVEPIATFFRGKVEPNPGGVYTTSTDVQPWPGRHSSLPVVFSRDGLAAVYDQGVAAQLDQDDSCARIAADDDTGDGDETEPVAVPRPDTGKVLRP